MPRMYVQLRVIDPVAHAKQDAQSMLSWNVTIEGKTLGAIIETGLHELASRVNATLIEMRNNAAPFRGIRDNPSGIEVSRIPSIKTPQRKSRNKNNDRR